MTLNYGLIGNCRTAALVSEKGSIDWCCFPRFDSPSVFAKLLDEKKGGSFEVHPVGAYKSSQRYVPNTNILETHFKSREGEFLLYDFFPRFRSGEKIEKLQLIVRYIKVVRGSPRVRIIFNPKFGYATSKASIRKVHDHLTATNSHGLLFLYSDLDFDAIRARKPITISGEHYLLATYDHHLRASLKMVKLIYNRTRYYWKEYLKFSTLPPGYSEAVTRSILTLKLLTSDSGAVVAAPTTSLPEVVGEVRNWDYRYCWLRDSSFTIDALTKICHFDEAENFIAWLTKICTLARKDLQIVYRVDGTKALHEKLLPHLAGYKGSRPVRIGNHAYLQKQLDIYGEIMETFYLFFHHYNYAEFELKHWKVVSKIAATVTHQWQEQDSGLWEFRGIKKHFTFSKLMCWVAMDRAVKMAQGRRDSECASRWASVRDAIRVDILEHAWSDNLQAFTQSYDSDELDASNLLMPYFGFIPATHQKMRRTIHAIQKHLVRDGFVFRYLDEDDFGKPKNAFTICTFWLIDALYMMGEKGEAKQLFRKILKYSNHLGLFSEDIDIKTGSLTGNFPQAYTHLAIINTATLLTTNQLRRPMCDIRLEMLQD
jgi:alpha,alpha-trehalase